MVATSVTDARAVTMVERLVRHGYIVRSRLAGGRFAVTITQTCEVFSGIGETFPEALYAALRELPQVAA
jgi:hypothetical protein